MIRIVLLGVLIIGLTTGGFLLFGRKKQPSNPASDSGIRYVALGDSYTIGEGEKEANRWPNQLVARLPELTLIANPSRTGYTTQDLLDREIGVLADSNAQFISLQIGVNDYFQGVPAATFEQQFKKVLDTIQTTSPGAKLLIVTIPDYGKTPTGARTGNPETIAKGVNEFNQIIINEAANRSLPVADVLTISQASSVNGDIVRDGLHPNGAQYTKWLEVIEPQARQLLR